MSAQDIDAATTEAFIAETAEYHRLRMTNLLNPRADVPRIQVARFDVERFIEAPAPPAQFRLPDRRVRRFTLTAAQTSLIEGYLKQFGSAAWGAGRMLTRIRIDDLLRHVEHIANIAGEDHVGVGTDNGPLPQIIDAESTKKLNEWAAMRMKAGIAAPGEGLNVWPMVKDYNSVDRYRRFAADLQKRGWSEARLEKLMGGNFLRVYRDAWGG